MELSIGIHATNGDARPQEAGEVARLRDEIAELHRIQRNTLANVRLLSQRTAATSPTVEHYETHLDGRLAAFARALAAVTRSRAGDIDLASMIADELMVYATPESDTVRLNGPPLMLPPRVAQTLRIALHELATNAIKFGVLDGRDGSLSIDWHEVGEGEARALHIDWTEAAELARTSDHRGFGFEIIEQMLPYELGATTSLDIRPEGLSCQITLPLPVRSTP